MPNTDNELRSKFGIRCFEWNELLEWQHQVGPMGALAAKIFACLESEAATSEWVDQAIDLCQQINVQAYQSGWRTTLLLRALDRDNDVNPCGCPNWGRYCWDAHHGYRHDDCTFQDCPHRKQREQVLVDAARRRFYGFDTTLYSRLRDENPEVYRHLHYTEGPNPAGVRAVAQALLHSELHQACRRPNRINGQRIVDKLIAAAAKFSGPRTFVNGVEDMSSTPVQDYLVARATEILQSMYPLRRTDRQGRMARRNQLVRSWMKLAGKRHVFVDTKFMFAGNYDHESYEFRDYDSGRYAPKPQCRWHSRRFQ